MLASAMQARGNACAVLDADITGPSIPKSFGIKDRAKADESGLLPEESKTGIKVMSINLLLENEESPVVWRGPVISGVIQQFWKDVAWGDDEDVNGMEHVYRLGGNSCLSGDFMGQWRFDHELHIGENVIFEDMLHYTTVKTNMFNGVNHPAIALLRMDGNLEILRQYGYDDYKNRMD